MNQLPNINVEFPFKWLKHIEKLDTSVFPTCHTVEREWKIYRIKPPSIIRNYMYIHHNPECKFDIVFIRQEREGLDIRKFTL